MSKCKEKPATREGGGGTEKQLALIENGGVPNATAPATPRPNRRRARAIELVSRYREFLQVETDGGGKHQRLAIAEAALAEYLRRELSSIFTPDVNAVLCDIRDHTRDIVAELLHPSAPPRW